MEISGSCLSRFEAQRRPNLCKSTPGNHHTGGPSPILQYDGGAIRCRWKIAGVRTERGDRGVTGGGLGSMAGQEGTIGGV